MRKNLFIAAPLIALLIAGYGLAADPLTVVAVGDIMMGSSGPRGILPPDDGQALFKGVSDLLKTGQIVFGNLEGPLADGGESRKCREEKSRWCFEFRTPTRYGGYLKQAGFNVLNLANNHTFDYGPEGLQSTLEALQALAIKPCGGGLLAEFVIRGKRLAVVGFSYLESRLSYSILDIPKAREIIRRLKETYDRVIVSFHGGAEGQGALRLADRREIFLGEDRGNVVAFSRAAIEAGADLVLGHGPHVLRTLELYRGKLIAYSLGNFLTYGLFNLKGPNGISVILKVRLDLETGDFVEGQIVPLKLVEGGIPEIDPDGEGIHIIKKGLADLHGSQALHIDPGGHVHRQPN
jgi:poly-gamma-glutamate capsule biosynthesis protein CapA/YwtB (metallophosphatase superfamily)